MEYNKIYRGFLCKKESDGWYIENLPGWSKESISEAPYATFGICCNTIDWVLRDKNESRD